MNFIMIAKWKISFPTKKDSFLVYIVLLFGSCNYRRVIGVYLGLSAGQVCLYYRQIRRSFNPKTLRFLRKQKILK